MLFHVNACPDSLPTQESSEHGASSRTVETAEGGDMQGPARKTSYGVHAGASQPGRLPVESMQGPAWKTSCGVHFAELLVVAERNADVTSLQKEGAI